MFFFGIQHIMIASWVLYFSVIMYMHVCICLWVCWSQEWNRVDPKNEEWVTGFAAPKAITISNGVNFICNRVICVSLHIYYCITCNIHLQQYICIYIGFLGSFMVIWNCCIATYYNFSAFFLRVSQYTKITLLCRMSIDHDVFAVYFSDKKQRFL